MDHKAWLWRKKSSEKTVFATNKTDNHLRRTEEVLKNSVDNGVEAQRSAKTLNEKLASVLLDCPVKEDVESKNSEETIADVLLSQEKEKEEKTAILKHGLDEVLLKQRMVMSENLSSSDAELRECGKQLSIVREEQEKKIREAVATASREYEKARKVLEDKHAEASKHVAVLRAENASMAKALLVKEKLVEDLNQRKSQAEAEFGALMGRLDSTEKENAFLKYEFHVIERELRIRTEEMEYYRRSGNSLQKQQSESAEKIAKLELECQRLCAPARKRLNGPSGLAGSLRSEAQAKARNQVDMRRRKSNPSRDMVVRDAAVESAPESLSKDVNLMLERLCALEEENEALKRVLSRKMPELHFAKPGVDTQLARRNHVANNKPCLSSDLDTGSEDAVSSSGSWANALISEFEHLKNGKHKEIPNHKASEISLMDDFVEMEKLAIVSADKPSGNSLHQDRAYGKPFDWLQVVLSAMLEQKHISKRSLAELLEDIKIALGFINSPVTPEANKTAKCFSPKEADPLPISGYLTWNSPKGSQVLNSSSQASSINTSPKEKVNQNIQNSVCESAGKIIKLIQDIKPITLASPSSVDYFIRVFQWRNSELNSVLQRFVRTCDDLMMERCNLERFAEEVASTLDWILNNYVTPREAANARDKIKKHFGWNEPEREGDKGLSLANGDSDMVRSEEQSLGWPLLASKENQDTPVLLEEETSRLKDELKSVMSEKADMESKLNLAMEKSEDLLTQLQESQQRVGSLQAELEAVKGKKGTIENQIENEKLISDDLDTQLTVAKAKLNEVFQKVSSLEVELEDKRNCCEELEATCLELQLQLESNVGKETPKHKTGQVEKQSQTGWEITAASAKLAECQETIVNLGKQLKALATPREAAILDKVFIDAGPAMTAQVKGKNLNKRASLRDRMLAEDGNRQVGETAISQSDGHDVVDFSDVVVGNAPAVGPCRSLRCKPGSNGAAALAIVPSKRKGGGFDLLRKLLVRRKRSNGQKSRYSTKV